ncbi:MAG: Holliday junction branch migration DNA helicase RuvB [Patescibacteria group bacterium]
MNSDDFSVISAKKQTEDKNLDFSLRPKNFEEYYGQEKIKENLKILIEAAQKRKEALEHILLYGPAGIGKTSLAHIIAKSTGANLKITSGPAIEKVGDLASILTNLADGDILFIDEIHRLNKLVEEILYPAMEDYVLDIIIGKGPSAKTLQLNLSRFTLIGATTRIGLLSSPFRSRFGVTHRLDFYNDGDVEKILNRSSKILNVKTEKSGIETIAQCSRKTPRVANRLLKRVRDYADVKCDGVISEQTAKEALKMLEIDEIGLEPADKRLLKIIIDKFNGGPVGLQALAAASSEEIDTIEDIYEPYLMQIGFIARTPRGRVATEHAYKHLGIKYDNSKQNILL